MEYEPVYDLTEDRIADLYECYRSYSWWADRELGDVRTAIEHSDVVVGLRDADGELVGGGRVLTDFVYYGKLYDIIVAEPLRGDGLGRELLEAIVSHPAVADVDVLVLDCREGLVPFYERCGFERHEGFAHRPGDVKGTNGGGSDSGGSDEEEPLVTMRYVGDESPADATGGAEPAS